MRPCSASFRTCTCAASASSTTSFIADGTVETLLRVNYHFHWQLSYRLAQPRFLKAGTRLQAVAWYDNSEDNPHNPDPNKTVTWGGQTYEEMMVGFFDVAVPANVDKEQFFVRHSAPATDYWPALQSNPHGTIAIRLNPARACANCAAHLLRWYDAASPRSAVAA